MGNLLFGTMRSPGLRRPGRSRKWTLVLRPDFGRAPQRLAALRLARARALGERRDPLARRAAGGELDRPAVVLHGERLAVEQRVDRLLLVDVHLEAPTAVDEPEAEPLDPRGQARRERQLAVVVAHAAESRDGGDARSGERRDVHAVARVVLEIAQVHERGLREVVVRELEVAGLRRQHRLRARRQRRVAYGQPLVVLEVAALLLVRERV